MLSLIFIVLAYWNNSLQISCSTLTHYTDSTETTVYRYLAPLLTHYTDSTETTVYRYLAPLWHIIPIPLKQQSTDILLHSDILYWFHWNNSLQISCSTLDTLCWLHWNKSTDILLHPWHIILIPLKQQSTDILLH